MKKQKIIKLMKECPDITAWIIGVFLLLIAKLGFNDHNLGWGYYSILLGSIIFSIGNLSLIYKAFTDKKNRKIRIMVIIISIILSIILGFFTYVGSLMGGAYP